MSYLISHIIRWTICYIFTFCWHKRRTQKLKYYLKACSFDTETFSCVTLVTQSTKLDFFIDWNIFLLQFLHLFLSWKFSGTFFKWKHHLSLALYVNAICSECQFFKHKKKVLFMFFPCCLVDRHIFSKKPQSTSKSAWLSKKYHPTPNHQPPLRSCMLVILEYDNYYGW